MGGVINGNIWRVLKCERKFIKKMTVSTTSSSSSSTSMMCNVCKKTEKKYKCPICLILYCSMDCFKSHKPSCKSLSQTESSTEEDQEIKVDTVATPPEKAFMFSTPNTVPLDKLQLLSKSEKLKSLLTNKHLCDFLQFLDSSEDKAMLMRKAMREPLFVEFVDVCLETINPELGGRNLTDEELLEAIQESVNDNEED